MNLPPAHAGSVTFDTIKKPSNLTTVFFFIKKGVFTPLFFIFFFPNVFEATKVLLQNLVEGVFVF